MQSRAVLCAVLDLAGLGPDPAAFASALFAGGVDWIQLRDRDASSERLFQTALALVAARDSRPPNTQKARVLLNRRSDIALAADADGVHLGFNAPRPADARQLLGPDALVGASFHSVEEVRGADSSLLSYAHLAPIWNPISKSASRPALGLEALQEASAQGLRLLAQGGVDEGQSASAIRAGASGVAVTGTLSKAADPESAARVLRQALDSADPTSALRLE